MAENGCGAKDYKNCTHQLDPLGELTPLILVGSRANLLIRDGRC